VAGLHAFIDEAGQRATTTKSSDHFIMSAVIVDDARRPDATKLLSDLRLELGRGPGEELHWRNIKNHGQRLHIAQRIGGSTFLTVSTVIVCKRQFAAGARLKDEDVAYLIPSGCCSRGCPGWPVTRTARWSTPWPWYEASHFQNFANTKTGLARCRTAKLFGQFYQNLGELRRPLG
jgi:hypothetical protein